MIPDLQLLINSALPSFVQCDIHLITVCITITVNTLIIVHDVGTHIILGIMQHLAVFYQVTRFPQCDPSRIFHICLYLPSAMPPLYLGVFISHQLPSFHSTFPAR